MEYTIVKSDFFDDFKCSADKCKYHCCQEWRIDLNKHDYDKMRGLRGASKETQEKIKKYIIRNKNISDNQAYANIHYGKNGLCPFFDGLCTLQVEFGYNILCDICKIFPRTKLVATKHNSVEQHLTTGCEEVVKLLMNKPEGIQLKMETTTSGEIFKNANKVLNDVNPIQDYYWDIKIMCMNILQNRLLSMDDRMVHLGMALQEIDNINKSGDLSNLDSVINEFNSQSQSGFLADMLKDIPQHSDNVVMSMLSIIFLSKGDILFNKIKSNLNIRENDKTFSFDMDLYKKANETMFNIPDFKEYIWENFVINTFLNLMSPFALGDYSIFENYCFFANIYSLMKIYLAGYIGNEPTEDNLIMGMVCFSRIFLHTIPGRKLLAKQLKAFNTTTLAAATLMIKA